MTPISIGAWIAVLVGYVLLRLYASHRVMNGHTRWLWVTQSLPIVIGAVLVVSAISMVKTTPVMAVLIGAFGLLMAVIAAVLVRRSIRAMAMATNREQRADAVVQPAADYALIWMALLMVGAIAMLVGVLVLGLSGRL